MFNQSNQGIICVVFASALAAAACGDDKGEDTAGSNTASTAPELTTSTTSPGDTTSDPGPTSGPEPTSGTTDPTDGTTGPNTEDPALYEQCKADEASSNKRTDLQCQCLVESGEFADMAACVEAYGIQPEFGECTCQIYGKNPETKDVLDCTSGPNQTYQECVVAAGCDVAAQDMCSAAYFEATIECPLLSQSVQNQIAIQCSGIPPFMCTSGEQIPEDYKCDLEEDCVDGSDEMGCTNGFMCTNGTTIPLDFKCDGALDCCEGDPECRDMSDEVDCPVFMCKDGDTVPEQFKCDGEENCLDGSDEEGCPVFMCMSGETIPEFLKCDGFPDCEDDSDEKNCPVFMCGSGEEIPEIYQCDGVSDCRDGSDELNCP